MISGEGHDMNMTGWRLGTKWKKCHTRHQENLSVFLIVNSRLLVARWIHAVGWIIQRRYICSIEREKMTKAPHSWLCCREICALSFYHLTRWAVGWVVELSQRDDCERWNISKRMDDGSFIAELWRYENSSAFLQILRALILGSDYCKNHKKNIIDLHHCSRWKVNMFTFECRHVISSKLTVPSIWHLPSMKFEALFQLQHRIWPF